MAEFALQNYCMAFVDLLGQREAMKGQGLLPTFTDETDEKLFRSRVRGSVGQIARLQEAADDFMAEVSGYSLRDHLSEDDKKRYDDATRMKMKQQRWSDGLVLYTSMRGAAPMNAIFEIFGTAGCLCLLGLARKEPVRGGIDISWGAELHDGELYGPVVANSYELETVAQYPRIVVGDRVHDYLEAAIAQSDDEDKVLLINKQLAKLCRAMMTIDVDGYWILNYLGDPFTNAVTKDLLHPLYKEAISFANEQLQAHQKSRNSKLAGRYNWLLAYFEAHQPK